MVLRHLDVTQPHPFLRLWERWGHGDGGEWLHPAPPPRLGWDLQPERRFGDVGRRRAWGNLPRPPPGWSVPFPVDHVEPTVPVEAGRDEYTHSHVTHDTSEPPEGVDYSGTHPVRSTRALGEPHATQLDTTHETTWCEVDESQEPYTNEADASETSVKVEPVAKVAHDVPDANAGDQLLDRKKQSVQATLERKLGELNARAASGAGLGGLQNSGTSTGSRADIAKDITITPHTPAPAPAPAPAPKPEARRVRSYSAGELKKQNANCDAPPPGFRSDPAWSPKVSGARAAAGGQAIVEMRGVPSETKQASKQTTSTSSGCPQRVAKLGKESKLPALSPAGASAAPAEASAAAVRAARHAAEMEAARAATSAVLRANTSKWSLWAPNDLESVSRRKDVADAFDNRRGHGDTEKESSRFREPEFLNETAAVARALRVEAEAAAANAASPGTAVNHSVPALVVFPPGALGQFVRSIRGGLAPGAKREPTLGILFGGWSWRRDLSLDAPNAWVATVAFLQPWQGLAVDLATWLEGEDAEAVGASRNSIAANTLRPIGWLRATAGLGAGVTEEIRDARVSAVARMETFSNSARAMSLETTKPPPASSLFVSLDDVRTAVAAKHAGGGAGAAVEVFDLRAGKAVDFTLRGDDAGE